MIALTKATHDHELERPDLVCEQVIARAVGMADDGNIKVADVEWIRYAGQRGWLCFTENPRIWGVPHERAALIESGTRVFGLADGNYNADAKGVLFGRYWVSITRRSLRPGACFWTLSPEGITRQLA